MVQIARPASDVAVASWTTQAGGTSNLSTTIDEASPDDADYVQSEPLTTTPSSEYKTRVGVIADPVASTGHVVRYHYGKLVAGSEVVNQTINLYDSNGTTLIATQTHTDVGVAPQAGTFTLSGAEADAVTGYASGLVLGSTGVIAPPFDPSDLTWLRLFVADDIAQVDGTAITTWTPRAGSTTYTQATAGAKPTYRTGILGGKAVARFDGGDAMQSAGAVNYGTAKATIYLVVNQTANGVTVVPWELTANAGTAGSGIGIYRESGNNIQSQVTDATGGAGHVDVITTNQPVQSTHKIVVLRVDTSHRKGKLTHWTDGVPNQDAFNNVNIVNSNWNLANDLVNLGARNNGASLNITGDVAFVGEANVRHTTTQLRNMLVWLGAYYGIAVTLPSGVIVFDGGSHVDATSPTVTDKPPSAILMQRFTDAYDIYNLGVPGQTMAAMNTDFSTDVAPLFDAGFAANRNLYIIDDTANDLLDGTTKETVWTRITTLATTARNAGFQVACCTMLPNNSASWPGGQGGTAQQEYMTTERPYLNNRITTEFVQNGHGHLVIDLAANTNIGDDGDENNTTYYNADKAHLTAAGNTTVADTYETALATLGIT